MRKSFHVYLKAGERLFVNGAVLRVDRKVSIEFLNDVSFLLEAHVMQPEQTTTPLRQLYFVAQTILMDRNGADEARRLYAELSGALSQTFVNPDVIGGLEQARQCVVDGRVFEALKTLRTLFKLEEQIMSHTGATVAIERGAVAV